MDINEREQFLCNSIGSVIKKATKSQSKLRIALCGISGSGKTYSSLRIATGIGGKILMVDTENGSGSLYANIFDYDSLILNKPFTFEKYIHAIELAQLRKYDVLIIDSLSHSWNGTGGALECATTAQSWKHITPRYNKMMESILQSDLHVIATMRLKQKIEIQNDNGKIKPVKIGLSPVQREDIEYDFTTVFDLSSEQNIASSSKDRTNLFSSKQILISEETGIEFIKWLKNEKDILIKYEYLSSILQKSKNLSELKDNFLVVKKIGFSNSEELKQKLIIEKERIKKCFEDQSILNENINKEEITETKELIKENLKHIDKNKNEVYENESVCVFN